jgi:hypothetical protein
MKSFVIGIACALLLVSFVPLVRAQEEQPAEQPPIIPPELAEGISEMGMGPIISFVLAAGAFILALIVDVIDTVIAWIFFQHPLLGVIFAIISIFPVIGLLGTWMKGFGHVALCFVRYLPLLRYIVVLWDLLKFVVGVI